MCLDCRACETACPSGVHYGRLIEPFRLADRSKPTRGRRSGYDWFRELILFRLFPYAERMRLADWRPCGWRSGLGSTAWPSGWGCCSLMPGRLGRMATLLPPLCEAGPKLPRFLPAVGRRRARVAFFVGCVADAMFRHTHWATLRVLQHNGCDVFVPAGQGCCGAIHFHAGNSARRPATGRRQRGRPSSWTAIDAVVVNHAGCGAMIKEYGLHWRDGLQPQRGRSSPPRSGTSTSSSTRWVSIAPQGRIEAVATYHDACHLAHAQGVTRGPPAAACAVPGLGLRELPEIGICCGSAGTYNLNEAGDGRSAGRGGSSRTSSRTGAQIVLASNAGCLLQIESEIRRGQIALAGDAPDGNP